MFSHAVRVSPQLSHRMVEAARSVLNRYIPDIYIHTDVYKGQDSGKCVITYVMDLMENFAHITDSGPR